MTTDTVGTGPRSLTTGGSYALARREASHAGASSPSCARGCRAVRAALRRLPGAGAAARAHALGRRLPVVGSAVHREQAGLGAAAGQQLRGGRLDAAVRALPAVGARAAAGGAAVEPARRRGAAVRGRHAVR